MNHSDQLIHIFFGDKSNAVSKSKLLQADRKSALLISPLVTLKQEFNLTGCFFQQQVHGVNGMVINKEYIKEKWIPRYALNDRGFLLHQGNFATLCHPEQTKCGVGSRFFSQNGDFMITNLSAIGLGILTADCLPIIMVDTKNHAIGIAHAGWRGSVQKIGPLMLQALQNNFNSKPSDITVYFGPSALPCCYEVDVKFKENLENNLAQKTIINRNGALFFDLPLYNKLLLIDAGIPQENFISTYNKCTLCTSDYCSYRREKDDDLRQITLVSLK